VRIFKKHIQQLKCACLYLPIITIVLAVKQIVSIFFLSNALVGLNFKTSCVLKSAYRNSIRLMRVTPNLRCVIMTQRSQPVWELHGSLDQPLRPICLCLARSRHLLSLVSLKDDIHWNGWFHWVTVKMSRWFLFTQTELTETSLSGSHMSNKIK